MKTALTRLLSSMKFWTFVLGLSTALGARYSFKVDPQIYWSIVGLTGLLLGAQGLTDHGKARAEIETRHIQSGFVRVEAMLLCLVLVLTAGGLVGLVGCAWLKSESKSVAHDVVDCTTDKVSDLSKTFGSTIDAALQGLLSDTGRIDRDGLKSLAADYATDTARCVFAGAVSRLLEPRGSDSQSTPLPIDTADVAAAWEAVRREQFGGLAFKLGDGT